MNKNSILLIEDDELDIISVERSLKKLEVEYILHTAYNGKEAMAMLQDTKQPIRPTVILLDINMPKMNGIEFLKNLRKEKRFDEIKVFVMTSSTENTDRSATQELGISGYIIKPLSYRDNQRMNDSMEAFVQFHLRKILNA